MRIGLGVYLVSSALPQEVTPQTIMGASTVAWWRADKGITLNGATVSAWADQGPSGFHLTQGTAAAQPDFVAAGGPNGTPSVLFKGTDDFLRNATLDRPAPSTTPTFVWTVMRQVTWGANLRFWCFGTANLGLAVLGQTATPQISMSNTTVVNANTALTVNTYKRMEVYFSGSTSDYLKVGATSVTGASAGVVDNAARFTLGARGDDLSPSNVEYPEFAIFSALPSAAQLTALDAYAVNRYGAVT
jgi:hypothetical protein